MSSRSPATGQRAAVAPLGEPDHPDRRTEIAAGARTVLPAGLAVIPLGLALGVLVVQSGFEWWWATLLAAIVFAGSLEFFLVGLFAAAAPLAQIAVSAVIVNFRHVFYALSFPLHRVTGRGWKAYSTFALTDEAYALTATPAAHGWTRARILTIQAGFHALWILFVTIGAGLGTLIPPQVVGLDFALTALFVVLGVEAYKIRRSLPAPALALGCAIIALLVSPNHMLMIAMGLFVTALVCGYLVTKRRRRVG
ncbi:branched-chain amino acid exporter BrnF [Leucobacter tardus]|uniref:AzlC family ABC transporter permease n=1 Tax=Leucobacter tardus TaxID=501483 RepID=A0A939TNR6_9MICO|nr:AzlC family ABC transporter permease [Leucobacter tardus]MBO2990494.1 AzlC family ABC transporter permease [Leucobacter tardus]